MPTITTPTRLASLAATLLSLSSQVGAVPAGLAESLFPSFSNNNLTHYLCLDTARTASASDGDALELSYPSSSDYSTLSTSYNPVFHYQPSLIALPDNEADVQAIVRCVSSAKGSQKISPKSGGHSYEAYHFGGADGFVVVDLINLQSISVDKAAKTARVGAGVRLGLLASTLNDQGFALPHGTCPYVGIGGHSTGGGYGLTSRNWGFLLDRIVSMEVVKADGSLVTVSPTENQDLFFALRGAGSNNFGMITSFTLDLEPAPKSVINFSYSYKTNSDCAHALVALQTLALSPDPNVGFPAELGGELLIAGQSSGNACSLSGQHIGATKSSHQAVISRLDAKTNPRGVYRVGSSVQSFNWIDSLKNIMGDLDTSQPYQDHEQFYAKSLVQPPEAKYTYETALKLVEKLDGYANLEGTGNSISFAFLGPTSYPWTKGDAKGESSFNSHKALFINQFYSYDFPTSNDRGQQDRVYAAFDDLVQTARSSSPNANWSAYVNYIDRRLQDWGKAYYGSQVDRLKEIKKVHDPDNIFDFPQGISHA
ncbi:FAD-binding domain-containing protein [Violaceomyces palustris]|uniref:FAD-binding domain-containing protein n=1 Tax=Violaceomyces palustris TaxID=1673888 RepID=A0ACD0P124_9BASI|nr:FAD-binding domain-containing protein [Violaceomyces palustris]